MMSIPSELFRFGIVRNIQAQKPSENQLVDLGDQLEPALEGRGDTGDQPPAIDPNTWNHWLTRLSTQLALAKLARK